MSKFYLFFLVGFVMISCQSQDVKSDLLLSKWTLTEGFRDGQKTDMLDGLYFEFGADGSLATNFLGMEEKGTYIVDKKDITLDIATKTKLTIEELSDSKLILTSMIQGRPFRFVFEKK